MVPKRSVFNLAVSLYVVTVCIIQSGQASVIQPQSNNSCIAYAVCTNPGNVHVTRVRVMLYTFNFYRLADGVFLQGVCHRLNRISTCQNLLMRCRNERWPETTYYETSDVELAQWVCRQKSRFEAYSECWDEQFLSEMSSCTGLAQFLRPTECLLNKIEDLDNCSQGARSLFQELLTAAHSL